MYILDWASQVAQWKRTHLPMQGDTGDVVSIAGSGRSPGGGNGNLPQYPCQENSIDRGVWQATAHWVSKSWTRLRQHTHTHI